MSEPQCDPNGGPFRVPAWPAAFEIFLIVGLCFLYAGSLVPGVNEAHYLAKAKHYWNPNWCPGDVFLGSADAHLVFYWAFGWLTRVLPLPAVAWVGRLIGWLLLAWAWQRLSWTIVRRRYASVLTAAWFILLNDRFNLAGEWAVGGVEAKLFAYALVFLGLRSLMLNRWNQVWLWLGAASAFHVVIGGWSVIAAGIAWLSTAARPPLRSMVASLIGGLLLALGGLIPALRLSLGVDPNTVRMANEIYVFQRLSHHLVFHQFAAARIVYFAALTLAWFGLTWRLAEQKRWQQLNLFVVGAILIAVAGAALDLVLYWHPAAAAALLRFYWFRLVDVAVPLAVALALPLLLAVLNKADSGTHLRSWIGGAAWTLAILIPGVFFVDCFRDGQRDFRPAAERQSRPDVRLGPQAAAWQWKAWRDLGRWVRHDTPINARFLTPRNQQTFKWYAQRSEVASWKDIPQDAKSILEWWKTLQAIYPDPVARHGLAEWSDRELLELAHRYKATYIVVDRTRSKRPIGLTRVYPGSRIPNPWFVIYMATP